MDTAWDSRYSTGIQIIDDQHQELFHIVEDLRRMTASGVDRILVEALLERLVLCAERHFATEESIMREEGYPDLMTHVAEHVSMIFDLNNLLAKSRGSHQSLVLFVTTFMDGWLRHHISDGDFGFVTYLKSKKLA